MKTKTVMSLRYPRQRASSPDMFQHFGQPGSKWPDAGLPAREIQGITVWVNPIVRVPGHKSSKHRVRCRCPSCGTEVSMGRLDQHVCPPVRPVVLVHIGGGFTDSQGREIDPSLE